MNDVSTVPLREVPLRLFAAARDLAGAETVAVTVPIDATIGDLRAALDEAFPRMRPLVPHLLFAIGASYVKDDTAIDDAGEIVAFPPVSGG
jgi:molybdopterin converting factor small subunit